MKNLKSFTKKIFNTAFIGIIGISIISCNPDNPQPSGSTIIKWNLTLDGQNYTWQDSYPESSTSASGGSQYTLQSNGLGQILLSNSGTMNGIMISISKTAMTSTGSYTFNQSNYSSNSMFSIMNNTNNTQLNTAFGGNIVVNITTFPSNSASVNGVSSSALVKGNFSGTIGKATGGTSTISGSFEAIRTH